MIEVLYPMTMASGDRSWHSQAMQPTYKHPRLQKSVHQKNDLNAILDRCWLTRDQISHQKDYFNAILGQNRCWLTRIMLQGFVLMVCSQFERTITSRLPCNGRIILLKLGSDTEDGKLRRGSPSYYDSVSLHFSML